MIIIVYYSINKIKLFIVLFYSVKINDYYNILFYIKEWLLVY